MNTASKRAEKEEALSSIFDRRSGNEERRAPPFPRLHMAWSVQASRSTTLRRDVPLRSAKVEASYGLPVQRAARRRRDCQFARTLSSAPGTAVAAATSTAGDRLDLDLPPRLSLSIGEPCFSVSLTYDAAGGPLDGASRVVARVGVAAWQWTQDVELVAAAAAAAAAREGEEEGERGGPGAGIAEAAEKKSPEQLWQGFISVPASRLPAPGHLDLQAAFFAPRGAFSGDSEERWDNAGGLNWGERDLR